MRFYLFDEDVIIASNNQHEARTLHLKEWGYECETVQEINDDFPIDSVEMIGSSESGYDQILLCQVVDHNKKLPYILDTDYSGY